MTMKRNVAIGGGGIAAAILSAVLYMEGGYVNDPTDPGGETNHGITVKVAREKGYTGPMIELTKAEAIDIYVEDYINRPKFDLVMQSSPAVAHKLIDAGVNVGTHRSSCWFQKSLNSLNRGGRDYPKISEDCKVGKYTLDAYNSLASVRGQVTACELVIKLIDAQQANHYMSLTKLPQFTVGWVDNRIGNVPLSYCKEYGNDSLQD